MEESHFFRKFLVLLLTVTFLSAGLYYLNRYLLHRDIATYATVQQNENVSVIETKQSINLRANRSQPTQRVLLLYPEARTAASAYAYNLSEIARTTDYDVIIAKRWFDLVWTPYPNMQKLKQQFPQYETWVVAGHGAAGSDIVCHEGAEQAQALVLLHGVCDSSIQNFSGPVLSLQAGEEPRSNDYNFETANINLPAQTKFFTLQNFTSAQFASYDTAKSDTPAPLDYQNSRITLSNVLATFLRTIR